MTYKPFSKLFPNWKMSGSVPTITEDDKRFFERLDRAAAEAERRFTERQEAAGKDLQPTTGCEHHPQDKSNPTAIAEQLGTRIRAK